LAGTTQRELRGVAAYRRRGDGAKFNHRAGLNVSESRFAIECISVANESLRTFPLAWLVMRFGRQGIDHFRKVLDQVAEDVRYFEDT
jgi:hypothetical protein